MYILYKLNSTDLCDKKNQHGKSPFTRVELSMHCRWEFSIEFTYEWRLIMFVMPAGLVA